MHSNVLESARRVCIAAAMLAGVPVSAQAQSTDVTVDPYAHSYGNYRSLGQKGTVLNGTVLNGTGLSGAGRLSGSAQEIPLGVENSWTNAAHTNDPSIQPPTFRSSSGSPQQPQVQLLNPIFSPDETPAQYRQAIYSPTTDPGQIIQAGAAVQSPDVPDLPNPTPLEPEPPSYTFLPEPDESEICPDCETDEPYYLYQQGRFVLTTLPSETDEIGLTGFNLQSTFTIPSVIGITVTPGFQMHFLDGPTTTDLPEKLYNARVEVAWMKQLNERFGYQLAIAPGIYSDFETGNSDALRIVGRALGFYAWKPQTQLVFGIAYLDREDVSLLPAFGLIHLPDTDHRIELVFPKPKVAYRLTPSPGSTAERWVYLAGEFGGGSWAIQRAGGAEDIASYSDWRLILGLESKSPDGLGWLVEAGVVFNRELEYKSGLGDFDPDSTGMLRAGLLY